VIAGFLLVAGAAFFAGQKLGTGEAAPASTLTLHPTATVLSAVRGLARLETTELYIEKVIDLRDQQTHLFGLVHADDALLMVAAGAVVMGVDLEKIDTHNVTVDPKTGAVTLLLPEPEVFSTRLDEQRTYVYARSTDWLAKRNEQLEGKARGAALAAIEEAARDSGARERGKVEAERQLERLLDHLGFGQVTVEWAPSDVGEKR
jgi:hypothetical protein